MGVNERTKWAKGVPNCLKWETTIWQTSLEEIVKIKGCLQNLQHFDTLHQQQLDIRQDILG